MTTIIDYSVISPAVLANIIENSVANAVCLWFDFSEDSFEFWVCGWDDGPEVDLAQVERVLAPYV